MAKTLKQGAAASAIVLSTAIALLGLYAAVIGIPTSYIEETITPGRRNDYDKTGVPVPLYWGSFLRIGGCYDHWRALVRETEDRLVRSCVPLCDQHTILVQFRGGSASGGCGSAGFAYNYTEEQSWTAPLK